MSVASLKAQPDLPLTQALDDLPCNVFYADLDLNLVYHNKYAAKTLDKIKEAFKAEYGIDVNNILGESIANFHPEPGRLPALLADDRNYPITTDVKVADVLMELQVNYVKDDSNQTIGYVVYWDDITEKREAQEMAFRLSQMVEQAPINMMTADPEGVLRYLNESSVKTLGEFEHLLPSKIENLVNNSIDWFHKNPAHPKKIFGEPANLPHKAIIQFGDEKLDLLVSALYDRNNNYIGPMVTWAKVTEKERLAESLKHAASQVSTAAEELLSVSESMSANAEETTAQANNASSASEEVTAGIQTVATNMEEMTASIREITKNTNEASQKSADATSLSNEANVIIEKLGESSLAIGNIIKVITSIAQQTNLLALNATIEAARAGEAGKGFAVVANEVKELAKQTATATEDISKKIEMIQSDSQVAVTSIGQVTEAINQLNAIATNIASSMEEQSATTNEVARVVSESTTGVSQITENIQQVSGAAEQTGKATNDMRGAANNLSKLAVELNDMVKRVIEA